MKYLTILVCCLTTTFLNAQTYNIEDFTDNWQMVHVNENLDTTEFFCLEMEFDLIDDLTFNTCSNICGSLLYPGCSEWTSTTEGSNLFIPIDDTNIIHEFELININVIRLLVSSSIAAVYGVTPEPGEETVELFYLRINPIEEPNFTQGEMPTSNSSVTDINDININYYYDSEIIEIDYLGNEKLKLQIFNIQGQLIMEQTVSNAENIALNHLVSGKYLLSLSDDNSVLKTQKIFKQ